ncbi:hypothetical protein DJ73_02195 [Halorubrum sp. Ea1]|uniref:hypothetical protein n=1 Tax=Halorubrum sp. Ea1 TaxID=1480718 RepID=UPI000B9843AF|nr:hypothetical protein [Halorubrum sp. Ea1]OYR55531.1 hypothetical protein DJ73_02195 [Halorubrum sp. Ea1]
MSSASDELPSGSSPAPSSVLTGTIGFLSAGGQLGTLLQGAIFGVLVSGVTGGINIIQSGVALVAAPLDALSSVVDQAVASLILAPLGVIETTAETSGEAASQEFGVFALLIGVGLVLGSYWAITKYLEQSETGDTIPIPGLGDAPEFLPLGVTEENEDEN